MRVHEVEQRSDEWFALRLGIPTASSFDKMITPTGKASTQADTYMHTLLAEWLTGRPGGMEPTPWMSRGVEIEPEARFYYEMAADVDVRTVGLITRDDGLVGCSPDGLVGEDGLLEIKVPAPGTHVEYLLAGEMPGKYRAQVQGQLYLAERVWADFLSYSPQMKPLLLRVERDEAYIATLAGLLDRFIARMCEKREKLRRIGINPAIVDVPAEPRSAVGIF